MDHVIDGRGDIRHQDGFPKDEFSAPIIKPPLKLRYDAEWLKPLLARNIQILLDPPKLYVMSWVIGKIIAVEDTSVIVLTHGQGSVHIPMSTIAAMIRLAEF